MAYLHKVLFISAPVGSGHTRAAQAVAKSMQRLVNSIEVKIANVFDFFNPHIGNGLLNFYLTILKICPQAYGLAYGWGNHSSFALWGRELISGYLAKRMLAYIDSYKPDAIVCTHATPAGLVAHLVKHRCINMPTYAVVTDFVVHRLWVYPEFSGYFVANEEMSEYLAQHGVSPMRCRVTGIPIDEDFNQTTDIQDTFSKFGLLPGLKTLLIMGGGAGVLPMDDIVTICDSVNAPFQIIAIAGNNTRMYAKLTAIKPALRHPLTVLGFTNDIPRLMSVSDLLITKPGGMTSAEALCRGLPMLIYRPIPGQEEANTGVLVGKQVAFRADSLIDVRNEIIRLLFAQPVILQQARSQASMLGKGEAAQEIAAFILKK